MRRCKACFYEYTDDPALRDHIAEKHSHLYRRVKAREGGVKYIECDDCSTFRSKTSKEMMHHLYRKHQVITLDLLLSEEAWERQEMKVDLFCRPVKITPVADDYEVVGRLEIPLSPPTGFPLHLLPTPPPLPPLTSSLTQPPLPPLALPPPPPAEGNPTAAGEEDPNRLSDGEVVSEEEDEADDLCPFSACGDLFNCPDKVGLHIFQGQKLFELRS